MSDIFLCSINNVSSGGCKEDCSYCTQSAKYKTDVETYKEKSVDEVLKHAKILASQGALGYCLVTSGRSLTPKKTEYICKLASAIKKENLGLHLIACCGSSDKESLTELKKSGVDSYNHNLETSKNFFEKICTTHTWKERYQTCEFALNAELGLCTGGIMGIGETWEDRVEFYKALKSLNPHTSPINFFIPHPNLPVKEKILTKEEALKCVKLAKEYLPNARLMMAGGREAVFGKDQKALFEAGINAVVLGDYLTAKGNTPKEDIKMLKSFGLNIATACH
ncbi:MAG: biotin synthase [Campylobacteraceae bacterium]